MTRAQERLLRIQDAASPDCPTGSPPATTFEIHVDGATVASAAIPAGGGSMPLTGAGAILVNTGSLIELVNTGTALSGATVAVGIAGTHV